jgi:hypothetical protein
MSKDTERALAHARSIQEKMTKRLDGRGSVSRAVSSGRFVSNAYAARHPQTTVREADGRNSASKTAD